MKLVTGEATIQFAVWVPENMGDVEAEQTAVKAVRKEVDSTSIKVVGRPRNVEVRNED